MNHLLIPPSKQLFDQCIKTHIKFHSKIRILLPKEGKGAWTQAALENRCAFSLMCFRQTSVRAEAGAPRREG